MNVRPLLAAAAATAALFSTPASGAEKPNILVILCDDLGYADLGFQGAKDIPTPNLDKLARGGVVCTSGYVSHPFCSPTRAGLMTGRYQQRFGHENNPTWLPDSTVAGLPLSQKTLPQMIKTAGYVTGMVGKWHLGAHPQFHPCARGFDEYFGLRGGGHDYFDFNLFKTDPARAETVEYKIPLHRNREPVEETGYLTELLGREAAAFVGRQKGKPWFLYLAFNAPHTPLQVPPAYVERVKGIADEKRRPYAAMICAMDDAIGKALDAVRDAGAEADTLVFFFSDNGGPVGVTHAANAPLRGAKGDTYEGGVRVPFVVRWPAKLKGGRTYDQPVISLDVAPTALAAAGAAAPKDVAFDGVDILPWLAGEKSGPPHARLFWRSGGGQRYAVREGDWKLVGGTNKPPELYHLAADIGEAKDLAAEKPDQLAALAKAYEAWNQELVPPIFESPRAARPAAKKAAAAR